MKDLLKPSGYDCPEELLDKTFEEATSGGDTKISTNTAATVDVSQYTEPVEITPAEGYDATQKVTLNLTNIPSGGVSTLYAWKDENEYCIYTTTTTPTTSSQLIVSGEQEISDNTGFIDEVGEDSITYQFMVFSRYSAGDVQLS
jgi:hypothetical protein